MGSYSGIKGTKCQPSISKNPNGPQQHMLHPESQLHAQKTKSTRQLVTRYRERLYKDRTVLSVPMIGPSFCCVDFVKKLRLALFVPLLFPCNPLFFLFLSVGFLSLTLNLGFLILQFWTQIGFHHLCCIY